MISNRKISNCIKEIESSIKPEIVNEFTLVYAVAIHPTETLKETALYTTCPVVSLYPLVYDLNSMAYVISATNAFSLGFLPVGISLKISGHRMRIPLSEKQIEFLLNSESKELLDKFKESHKDCKIHFIQMVGKDEF